MTDIVLVGAAGRMGAAITLAATESSGCRVVAGVDPIAAASGDTRWSQSLAAAYRKGTVVVDFSSPSGAVASAQFCAANGAPLVCGTTGLDAAAEAAVREAGARVAVFRASNFSIGVAALRQLLATALQAVPKHWDIEIVEKHHRLKKDAPSGTALTLADDALAARGLSRDALRHGRHGVVGARTGAEIGVHAVRGGTFVGDHQILLAGDGESLEIRHVAEDRAAFAHGAVAAARFVGSAPAGVYGMNDLLK
ncbi:MAG: 4-hydroxy-tetrahydrodipicolinate reductase [Candidatus Eisenbacteria bacterium]|nr:4-hydroxy-tetrahydrodipicolinate reductase [Candidatus Eisenbacteria bacterium]